MSKLMRLFIVLLVATGAVLFNTWASALGIGSSKQTNSSAAYATNNQMVFNGIVQAIDGNQWTINNKVFNVGPSAIQYGTLGVGSSVKVQTQVDQNGSITVSSIGPQDDPMLHINTTSNSIAVMPGISTGNIMMTTTPKSDDQNEQDENKITGTLTAITGTSITVDGKIYTLTSDSEIKSGLTVGSTVKLEYYAMPDGTFSVEEIYPTQSLGSNSSHNDNYNGNYNNNSTCPGDEHDDEYQNTSNSGGPCQESDDGD